MATAIIQARMGSSRLNGKVMLELCGKPVLWHVVERVKRCNFVDKIIVATGENTSNDIIREFCSNNHILSYSGSDDDVLDRFYMAAKANYSKDDDIIIRITADCPLIDSEVIDRVIEHHKMNDADYTSNTVPPTFPDGLDCEAMNFAVLTEVWKNAQLRSEREHVTLYIINHPEIFKIATVKNDIDLSGLRWTLDEEDDYKLIKSIYNKLYNEGTYFSTSDIIALLEHNPELNDLNEMISRNEGLLKSLAEDKEYLRGLL